MRDINVAREDSKKLINFKTRLNKFIDDCSSLLHLEVVVYKTKGKDSGKIADETNTTAIELYRMVCHLFLTF